MTAFCVAVDWGTTSLRLWVLARDGTVLSESRGPDGILSVKAGSYPDVLDRHLVTANAASGLPVIICGMAGARQGWVEAPYADTPADVTSLGNGAVRIDLPDRDVRIIPGVAQRDAHRPDVMRGEETQLLGLGVADARVCIPGTHSKWVSMSAGRLTGFSTCMTGELYSILTEHSILRHSSTEMDFAADNGVFLTGIEAALRDDASLSQSLFNVRARGLVSEDDGMGAAYLSGLLIGSEIAAARAEQGSGKTVTLLASGRLAAMYENALSAAGMKAQIADAELASRNGLLSVAREIWGDGRNAQ